MNAATALLVLVLAGARPASPAMPQATSVSFAQERVTVWVDRSQLVPFALSAVAEAETTLPVQVDDPELLEVVREPAVTAGASTGFVRVRGLRAGQTRLSVGDASVDVRVAPLVAEARLHRPSVRVTSPVAGATAWGPISVGVEVSRSVQDVHLVITSRDRSVEVADRGRVVRLARVGAEGPAEHYQAVVQLPEAAGTVGLHAVGRTIDLEEIRSESVWVRVAVTRGLELLAGECEASLEAERPREFGAVGPRAGSAPSASGGGFVVLDRPDPSWLLPFEVAEDGHYQMIVVARGDFGAGAFPSVGLVVDEPRRVLTAGRLVDRAWQRMPVGRAIPLEAGTHTLALRFVNDMTISSTSDRNLYLDRFELARVASRATTVAEVDTVAAASMSMMSMSAPMQSSMASGADSAGDLLIAWERPIDGMPVTGRLALEGYCRYVGMGEGDPPEVRLLVDGEIVASQRAVHPVFGLARAVLREGANEVQLVATLPDGRRAETPVQTLVVREAGSPSQPRTFHRFGVHDPRWDRAVRDSFIQHGQEAGHFVARPGEDARFELALPDDLTGEFDVVLDARGPNAPAPPARVAVSLIDESGETALADASIANWWNYRPTGVVTLHEGPKRLALDVEPGPGAGRDGLALRALFLRSHRATPDRTPPRARILYPPADHAVYGADVVVVEAWDPDERLERCDVLVDGEPQGTFTRIAADGAGYLVLPLILRDVSPGEHTLAVRASDNAKNIGESEEIRIVVQAEEPPERGTYARAVHLANRFGFGPDPATLAAILLDGERAWLERSLAARGAADEAALGAAQVRRLDYAHHTVGRCVLAHLLRSPNAARNRLVLWVDNHFSTWIRKTQPAAEWFEHMAFQDLGAAPFGELLAASITSPAMLQYLDQVQSYAGHLNENYAREVMELHTVGVDGGYTQDEVTELAWLLTGATLSEEAPPEGEGSYLAREFRFDPQLSDGQERTVLGVHFEETAPEGRFDRLLMTLELLAAHPSTARFVCRKLAEHYVSAPAPEELVEELALVFQERGGDLGAVALTIAWSPFFQEAAPRFANPLDFGLRLARATQNLSTDNSLRGYLERSGMGLFDRATPDGYSEADGDWANTNALLQRWRLSQEIQWAVNQLVPDALRPYGGGDMRRWRQRAVDVAAVRLTGFPLEEASNQAALEFLAAEGGNTWEQARKAAIFVSRTPEASLR